MTPPPLIDTNGHPFPLGPELASGGEGAVFALPNDLNRVAKLYHHPPTVQTVKKLSAMIPLGNPQLLTLAAWPSELLRHSSTRKVAGFVMPRMIDCQPIQHLYNPVQRLKFFPHAGWTFQVRAAQNLAAAFDEIHKTGCLVGDVNQSNAQVSPQALVRLIDCDSFQVRASGKQYLCEVGVPHYTPPELQGKPLRGLVRTENHDRFGLAVLLYQLLFVGRHPFAGIYRGTGDPSFEQLIAEFRFAQGPLARSWGMDPPPHTPTFDDIPPDVGMLFRRAFERGSETGTRPQPSEWLPALQQLEQNTVECPADAGHKYWRGATSCVWCRLATNGGPEYYFGVAGGIGSFAVDEARLTEILRRLAAVLIVEFPVDRAAYDIAKRPFPRPFPPDFAQLEAVCAASRQRHQRGIQEEKLREEKEEQLRRKTEKQLVEQLNNQLAEQEKILDKERTEALKTVHAEHRDRKLITWVLLAITLFGGVISPFLFFQRMIGVIGIVIALVFGTWLGIHHALARRTPAYRQLWMIRSKKKQARLEARNRLQQAKESLLLEKQKSEKAKQAKNRQAEQAIEAADKAYWNRIEEEKKARSSLLRQAEQQIAVVEKLRHDRVETYRQEHPKITTVIQGMVHDCRDLARQYQIAFQRLTLNAEVIARLRHLRLHLLADADIPRIGATRKQTLAAYNICTAADIDEAIILGIKGFGDALTNSLMAWRDEVLRQFRFNPATGISPGEQRLLTVQWRTRQQQILAELDRQLSKLESLAPACRAAIQKVMLDLQKAVAAREQAEADLRGKIQKG